MAGAAAQAASRAGPFIRLERIRKKYRLGRVEVEALRGVSMEVERGDFVSIMGPSGGGKSTLLNLLGCLDRPTEGRYLLEGRAVESLGDDILSELRNRTFGFVFQTFHLLPYLDARGNVELPLFYRGLGRRERRRLAEEALEKVGLSHRTRHRPAELSGGEQQRVAIARAIVARPEVLLADEPTGALDSQTGKAIMEIFRCLNEEGITVIQVTHDPAVAAYGRRIIRLVDGRVAEEG